MPARSLHIRSHQRKGKYSKRRFNLVKVLSAALIILLFLGFILYTLASRRFWNGKDKLAIAIHKGDGGVDVVVFDPTASEITNIHIPGNTEIEVAKNLGIFRLKSLWKLGESEGLGGILLTRSLTKHFKFPIYAWADSPALGFVGGGMDDFISAVASKYDTNLKFGDKLFVGLFSLSVNNLKRKEIDLSQSNLLKKTQLADGYEGYKLSGNTPQSISTLFADSNLDSPPLFKIIDASGSSGVAEELAQILQNLGGKVASIGREKETEVGCLIKGKRTTLTVKLTLLLPCRLDDKAATNFDYEITIGKEFVREF